MACGTHNSGGWRICVIPDRFVGSLVLEGPGDSAERTEAQRAAVVCPTSHSVRCGRLMCPTEQPRPLLAALSTCLLPVQNSTPASGCPHSMEAFSPKRRGSGREGSFQVGWFSKQELASPGSDLTSLTLSYSLREMGLIRVPTGFVGL